MTWLQHLGQGRLEINFLVNIFAKRFVSFLLFVPGNPHPPPPDPSPRTSATFCSFFFPEDAHIKTALSLGAGLGALAKTTS